MQQYKHLDIIKSKLEHPIQERGVLYVGNNLNQYITFDAMNEYAKGYSKPKNNHQVNDAARQEKSSNDVVLGRLVEEIIMYLLNIYFSQKNQDLFARSLPDNEKDLFSIERKENVPDKTYKKKIDVDVIITHKKYKNTYFLISAKGTSRERIGQYLSHLFLLDSRAMRAKYGEKYIIVPKQKGLHFKYAFVCMDWAKDKDFLKHTKTGKLRNTVKNTEVKMVQDDTYIGGGVVVLNNKENMDGVLNFEEFVGVIEGFFKKQ